MTHHDDPDTTTPIDTTTGQAPVEHELDDLAHVYCRAGIHGDELARALESLGWGPTRQNVPATPARVSTPAELDALPDNTPIRDCMGDVGIVHAGKVWYPETAAMTTEYVAKHYAPFVVLTAEAEARGYERGKRDALTEAADAWGDDVLVPVTARYVRDSLLRRAAETPGGAA